ncbi:MAG: deoxyribose-phosphate aldolase [Erysipelotrichaceae bacterium]|nr:deoxyribose-phosphate aldolase [Erysipelotrichaceae bacterium]
MNITEFAGMVEATAVQYNMAEEEIIELMDLVNRYRFKAYAVMPEYEELAERLLKEAGNDVTVKLCGIDFPDGTSPTEEKIARIKHYLKKGVGEIDIFNNIDFVKSGNYEAMADELRQLVAAAGEGMVTKVIIETPKLSDEEIVMAARTVMESGVSFVKTASGYYGPTTLHHVELINETLKGRIGIKAAGGIRDLETIEKMMANGVTRFGIGIRGIKGIIKELEK